MPSENPSLLDKIQWPLFILGLCLLCFIGGATAAFFEWPAYMRISDALSGAQAWYAQKNDEAPLPTSPVSTEEALAKARISWNREKAFNGYTFMTLRFVRKAYLIDMDGKVVHSWHMPFRKAWPNPSHIERPVRDSLIFFEGAQLMPSGDVLLQYTGLTDTPWGYGLARIDKDSKLLWTYSQRTHHNVYNDPETGNIYALIQEFIRRPKPEFEGLHYPMLSDSVVILSADGKEQKRIGIPEAFKNTPFEPYLYHNAPVTGAKWDLLHTNSVMKLPSAMADKFPMFKPGQILISMREISVIAVLDPDSGKIIWAARGPWLFQHDAKFLANGTILLMDNLGCFANLKFCSRVMEYNPATTGITWSYPTRFGKNDPQFLNMVLGHVQRLPNGNTFLSQPYDGSLLEITPSGERVWQYTLPLFRGRDRKVNSEYILRNKQQEGYPRKFLSNRELDLSNVLIYSERFAPDALPFLNPQTQPALQ
jgi:hypothetical protein